VINGTSQTALHIVEGEFKEAITELAAFSVGLSLGIDLAEMPIKAIILGGFASALTEWAANEVLNSLERAYKLPLYDAHFSLYEKLYNRHRPRTSNNRINTSYRR
jgi:hypothetical protein